MLTPVDDDELPVTVEEDTVVPLDVNKLDCCVEVLPVFGEVDALVPEIGVEPEVKTELLVPGTEVTDVVVLLELIFSEMVVADDEVILVVLNAAVVLVPVVVLLVLVVEVNTKVLQSTIPQKKLVKGH
jgi:hypothetical protein